MTSGTDAAHAVPQTRTEQPASSLPPVALFGEISDALAGSLNVRRTVLRLVDAITPRLADWAMVAIVDHTADRLDLYGGADPAFTDTVPRVPDRDTGLDRVLRSGQAELLHLVDEAHVEALVSMVPHGTLGAEAARLRPADVLGVALTVRGSTIGVLVLARGAGRGFAEKDIALLGQVAGRVAVALDAARLYEERNHIASVLQAGLRPPALPDVASTRLSARFRAADEQMDIGGDFYDVHADGDDCMLVLGDVCGKGVEAAVLTGRARQSIRTAVYFDRSPAAVLGALNSVLYEEGSDRFVTVVCARMRPNGDGSATVDIAVAGHPAPIVLRADGGVEQVEVTGTVAGVLPSIECPEVTVRLGPRDAMLMFTDGIYEARSEIGFYGMERLTGLLPAHAGADPAVLCDVVERDVVEFLHGCGHDDMALLAAAPSSVDVRPATSCTRPGRW